MVARQRNRALNAKFEDFVNRPPPLPELPAELRDYELGDETHITTPYEPLHLFTATPSESTAQPPSSAPQGPIEEQSLMTDKEKRRSRPRIDPAALLPPLDLAASAAAPFLNKPRSSVVDPATMIRPQLARLDLAASPELPRRREENSHTKIPTVILIIEAPEYQMKRTLKVEVTSKMKDLPLQFVKGQKNTIATLEDYALFLVISNNAEPQPQSSSNPKKMFKRQNKQQSDVFSTRMLPPNSTICDLELKDMVPSSPPSCHLSPFPFAQSRVLIIVLLLFSLVHVAAQADTSAGNYKANMGRPS